ncbi:MAG: response regulator, partial [candidate division Zixibacteria bacterium]|nr:response regulator [candidate division Zixibacteria bacterium]
MKDDLKEILWVDDEIELLKPHILFLEGKGCKITPVATGEDALDCVGKRPFDLVLLDEQMPGKDGLATLEDIKDVKPNLPVVMVTKSEEENIMNQAIGKKIDDYLTKPVNPSQVWLVVKKVLDSRKIRGSQMAQDYIAEFNRLRAMLFG